MTRLHTVAEVAEDLRCSEWTVAELVRLRKVPCIRINTAGQGNGPIRFTDEHVAQIEIALAVGADKPPERHRRKRRSA